MVALMQLVGTLVDVFTVRPVAFRGPVAATGETPFRIGADGAGIAIVCFRAAFINLAANFTIAPVSLAADA